MNSFNRTVFYFISHPDDWQLFMAPEINHDIFDSNCKVVIVHTTAGDASKNKDYWRAREIASIESLLFLLSHTSETFPTQEELIPLDEFVYANRYTIRNCVMYFLRLPDGNFSGDGFCTNQYQSLNNFRLELHNTLSSVDGQSIYQNWNHLVNVIDHIISMEQSSADASVCLNVHETDTNRNLETHSDHYNTGLLIQSTTSFQRFSNRLFIDYAIKHHKDNLEGEELFWKIGSFTAYHQSVLKATNHTTIAEDSNFIPWCFRKSSWRTVKAQSFAE
jgi:hypothetical protein